MAIFAYVLDTPMAKLEQSLQLKQQMRLSPQQVQVVRLLELPTLQLEQKVKEELMDNPTLEEVTHDEEEDETIARDSPSEQERDEEEFGTEDYLSAEDAEDYHSDYDYSQGEVLEDKGEYRYPEQRTMREAIEEQVRCQRAEPALIELAIFLVGNLDNDGYLRRPLRALADDLVLRHNQEVPVERLEEALKLLQQVEPRGIGARSLQECLLLQLEHPQTPEERVAAQILRYCFDEFARKQYTKVTQRLNVTNEELRMAIEEILRLNPRPADLGGYTQGPSRLAITPDFTLALEGEPARVVVSMNGRNTPELRLNQAYAEMAARRLQRSESRQQKSATLFARRKVDQAKAFIEALAQRNQTMITVMASIATQQEAYLLTGKATDLHPMTLKVVADDTGLDISTISRVVNGKYVQTPIGIVPLRTLFSEGIQNRAGDEISSREVKEALLALVASESKVSPLTDEVLRDALAEQGYEISRRTVAKYREQLRIPVARLRREL